LDMQNMNGIPLIEHVQVSGPFNPAGPGDTPSRRRLFVCTPAAKDSAGRSPSAMKASEDACAKTILSTLARRAYRRPIDTDIDTLLGFYDAGRAHGGFHRGSEDGLRFILTSPKFLFRDEPDPPGVAPGAVYPITDLELA